MSLVGTWFAPSVWMRRATGVIVVIFTVLSSEACSPRTSSSRPVEQPRPSSPQRRAERPPRSAEVPPQQSAVPVPQSTAQQGQSSPGPVATVGSGDLPGMQATSGREDAGFDSVRQPDSGTAAAEANSRDTTAELWLESHRVRAPGIQWAIGFLLIGLAFLIGAMAHRRLRS
jgi:hypothetical protein